MKLKKGKVQILIGALALLLITTGCNDFLRNTDPSHYTVANYYKSASDAQSAVNAIYASIYPIYRRQAWMIGLVRTGIANTFYASSGGFSSLIIAKKLGNFADLPTLQTLWKSYYRGITNANIAIKHIPDIEMDKKKKRQLLGQAHFLRAYFILTWLDILAKFHCLQSR